MKLTYENEIGEFIDIDVRNVGDKNPNATIQISGTISGISKRTKFISLSVPENKVELFIKACTETDLLI